MSDNEPAEAPAAAGKRRGSSVILMAALFDLLVIVPYTYWALGHDRLVMSIAYAIEGIGLLALVCTALYLRRRGM